MWINNWSDALDCTCQHQVCRFSQLPIHHRPILIAYKELATGSIQFINTFSQVQSAFTSPRFDGVYYQYYLLCQEFDVSP